MPRVSHYHCTVYRTDTGSSHERLYAFTQDQARDVGAELLEDGIPKAAAEKLIAIWSRRGVHPPIRYSYRLPACCAA